MFKPSLLLFDLGGVLTENALFDQLNRLMADPLDGQAIRHRWLMSPAVRAFELGEIPAAEFAAKFIEEWRLELSAENFLAEFSSWPKGFYPEARDTLRKLRKTHRVACLSNSNPLHCEKFGSYREEFDVALYSHLIGVVKPDREAFEKAVYACGVQATEVCYFDDNALNVEVAEAMGMHAFLVEGFPALLQVLHSKGLLEA